jgi:hypothetical protein
VKLTGDVTFDQRLAAERDACGTLTSSNLEEDALSDGVTS